MAEEIELDAPETRIERFLAAAAGMDGITLDEPETRIEKYLYKIAQGSGGVPAVEDADKGKFLHANESTGDLEWAVSGGGGGGGSGLLLLNVTIDPDAGTATLDHTWQEIADASETSTVAVKLPGEGTSFGYLFAIEPYTVGFFTYGVEQPLMFVADSADGYPVANISDGGGGGGN